MYDVKMYDVRCMYDLHLRSTLVQDASDDVHCFVDDGLGMSCHKRRTEQTFAFDTCRRDNRIDVYAFLEHLLTEIEGVERLIGEDRHDRRRSLDDLHAVGEQLFLEIAGDIHQSLGDP